MADPRLLHPEPVRDFTAHVKENQRTGSNILGLERQYVPIKSLDDYWEGRNLATALKGYAPVVVAPHASIRANYTRVLSMLHYTKQLFHLSECFIIRDLYDDRLPLVEPYPQWGDRDSPLYEPLFRLMAEHQWRFCPFVFDSNHLVKRQLEANHVLPFRFQQSLHLSYVSNVHKVVIDDDYNELVDKDKDGKPTEDTFVLKTYDEDSKDLWDNEVTAYTQLLNRPSQFITRYYGSFTQSGKLGLLLEYANGGSLLDFFEQIDRPTTPEQCLQLWRSFSGYFKGLHRLHQIRPNLLGIHGDIKPDNMLRSKSSQMAPYRFVGKITDFGHSHFRSIEPGGHDVLGLDRHGNQQYSAPETCHHTEFRNDGPNRIDHTADIFSIGCVTSEVIIWIAFGEDGRQQYFRKRKDATSRIKSFRGSGYEGCFHNAVERLPEVDQAHDEARKALPGWDRITTRMIDLVENHLLCDAPLRWHTTKLQTKFENILDEAEAEMLPTPASGCFTLLPEANGFSMPSSRQSTPGASLPGSSKAHKRLFSDDTTATTWTLGTLDGVHDATSHPICDDDCSGARDVSIPPEHGPPVKPPILPSSPYGASMAHAHGRTGKEVVLQSTGRAALDPLAPPRLTIPALSSSHGHESPSAYLNNLTTADLSDYRDARKAGRPISRKLAGTIERLERYVADRRCIFFIDDSETMANHIGQLKAVFRGMSYVAKTTYGSGIEMIFASRPLKVFKGRKTTRLLRKLQDHTFNQPSDTMEAKFGQFVLDYLKPSILRDRKSMTVYVLTDGWWSSGAGRAGGVEKPVQSLAAWLAERNIPRPRICLSFIQFGAVDIGTRHLEFLDNFGKESIFRDRSGRMTDYDIVDAGSVDGNLFKLFVGSVTEENDNNHT